MILASQTLAAGGAGVRFAHNMPIPATLSIQVLTGSAQLELSMDDGATWVPLATTGGAVAFTAPAAVQFSAASGGLFRMNQTSGTGLKYRVDV